MYDATDFFLVENPIGRYSIGDRTPGLAYGEDGSLSIALQHDEPTDPALQANWLPIPAGPFRPLLRIDEPDEAIFDGRWQPAADPTNRLTQAQRSTAAPTPGAIADAKMRSHVNNQRDQRPGWLPRHATATGTWGHRHLKQ